MSTYIWFVPGFMGSALSLYQQTPGTASPGRKLADLWGTNASLLHALSIEKLALPSALPPGQSIQPSGLTSIAGEGYENFSLYVVNNMPNEFVYSPWAYDWRQSARDLGRALATQLEANTVKGNTNIVVAHSFGALIAWSAWAALVDDGQQAAMSRLITFGGALYGSTSTPQLFLEKEDSIDQIQYAANLLVRNIPGFPLLTLTDPGSTIARILINTASTWPGLYDLYPDVSLLDDPGDTNRGLLFNPSAWAGALVQPNFTVMAQEVARVHQYVRQAKYAIPAAQVAHIVGTGHNTPYRVLPATMTPDQARQWGQVTVPRPSATAIRRQALPGVSTTILGDRRCTVAQQMFPGGYFQNVASQHAAMQDDTAVRQLVVALLTATFPTQPPTPPLQVVTTWTPPSALPNVPPFVFNNDPINTQAPTPPLPSLTALNPPLKSPQYKP